MFILVFILVALVAFMLYTIAFAPLIIAVGWVIKMVTCPWFWLGLVVFVLVFCYLCYKFVPDSWGEEDKDDKNE